MRKKKYKRNCPDCGKEVMHVSAKNCQKAIANGNLCHTCAHSIKNLSEETRIKLGGKWGIGFEHEMYKRKCSKCGILLMYKRRCHKYRADRSNSSCISCSTLRGGDNPNWGDTDNIIYRTRNCPSCNNVITHKKKRYRDTANQKRLLCGSCAITKRFSDPNEREKARLGTIRTFEDPEYRDYHFEKSVGMPRDEYIKSLPELTAYKYKVSNYTRKQPIHLLEGYKGRGKYTNHLDHIVPVIIGYWNDIPVEKIGDISNLRFITAQKNQIKNDKMTKSVTEKLIEWGYDPETIISRRVM